MLRRYAAFRGKILKSKSSKCYDDPEQYLYDWVVYNPNCKHFALSESDFRFIIHQEVEKLSKEVKENGVLLRDALEKIANKYLDK
jgi:hypothetical protein